MQEQGHIKSDLHAIDMMKIVIGLNSENGEAVNDLQD
jgi:hypothetical protein